MCSEVMRLIESASSPWMPGFYRSSFMFYYPFNIYTTVWNIFNVFELVIYDFLAFLFIACFSVALFQP